MNQGGWKKNIEQTTLDTTQAVISGTVGVANTVGKSTKNAANAVIDVTSKAIDTTTQYTIDAANSINTTTQFAAKSLTNAITIDLLTTTGAVAIFNKGAFITLCCPWTYCSLFYLQDLMRDIILAVFPPPDVLHAFTRSCHDNSIICWLLDPFDRPYQLIYDFVHDTPRPISVHAILPSLFVSAAMLVAGPLRGFTTSNSSSIWKEMSVLPVMCSLLGSFFSFKAAQIERKYHTTHHDVLSPSRGISISTQPTPTPDHNNVDVDVNANSNNMNTKPSYSYRYKSLLYSSCAIFFWLKGSTSVLYSLRDIEVVGNNFMGKSKDVIGWLNYLSLPGDALMGMFGLPPVLSPIMKGVSSFNANKSWDVATIVWTHGPFISCGLGGVMWGLTWRK